MGRLATVLIACGALVMLAYLFSFVRFQSYGLSVGGTPSNGKVEGGRYYVGGRSGLHEVSEEDWDRGVALERRLLASFLLVVLTSLLSAIVGLRRVRRRRLAEPGRGE